MEQESICSPKTPKSQEPEENTHTHDLSRRTSCSRHQREIPTQNLRVQKYTRQSVKVSLWVWRRTETATINLLQNLNHIFRQVRNSLALLKPVQEIQESFQKSCSDWFLNTTNNKHPGYLN